MPRDRDLRLWSWPRPRRIVDAETEHRTKTAEVIRMNVKLPLTRWSTVADALARLDGDEADAAVVFYDGRPDGVITRGALVGHGGFRPRPGAHLGDVMDLEVVQIEPDADMDRTMSVYTNAAWRSLARRMPVAADTVMRRRRAFAPLAAEPAR
jgi:hypothetical protein